MTRKVLIYLRQNVLAVLALFVALSTGGAYAANTIGSSDIIDGQVKSVDIGNGEVNSADVKDQSLTTFDVSTFLGADIVDGSLTSADVAPGTFVAGRGQLLSNRLVSTPSQTKTLLDIPGLGRLQAQCSQDRALLYWENTTGGPVDVWTDYDSPGRSNGAVARAGGIFGVVASEPSNPGLSSESSTLSLGTGADPGPRKVATIHVSAFQEVYNNPCGFQAQGTLWTSP